MSSGKPPYPTQKTGPQQYPIQHAYPTQPTAVYPQQQVYTQQYAGYPPPPQPYPQAGLPPQATGPPPPYSVQTPMTMPPTGYLQNTAPQAQPMYPMHPAPPIQRPISAVGQYDAAARFGAGASYNIPPPPPGVMPNSAQMAQMHGQNVAMNQKKSDWMSGSGGGGYTFW